MCVCVCVYMYVCMCVCIYVYCVYVCKYVCVYVCMCVCVFVYFDLFFFYTDADSVEKSFRILSKTSRIYMCSLRIYRKKFYSHLFLATKRFF